MTLSARRLMDPVESGGPLVDRRCRVRLSVVVGAVIVSRLHGGRARDGNVQLASALGHHDADGFLEERA